MKKLNILQIGTVDNKGGAALVSYHLKRKLEKLGYITSMFVKRKYSDDKNIFLIEKQNKLFKKISRLLKKITTKDIPNYIKNKIRLFLSNDIAFFNNKNLLNSAEFKNADIIHCHNLHGNYFNLKLLQKISKIKPVIWTLHDMWAITPHEAWIIKDKNDIVKFSLEINPPFSQKKKVKILKQKKEIYKNSQLNIIPVSNWLERQLKESILKNQNINLIYNGINNITFKKSNKIENRKELNIPLDKKIITFLANGGRNNKQKGWEHMEKIINHY